jgi:hypothetical protein
MTWCHSNDVVTNIIKKVNPLSSYFLCLSTECEYLFGLIPQGVQTYCLPGVCGAIQKYIVGSQIKGDIHALYM